MTYTPATPLQTQLSIGAVNDQYEQEADHIMARVMQTSPPAQLKTEGKVLDFSKVRLHTDAKAAQSAKAVNALAYTVGQNVVFGTGQYRPDTNIGKRLLAHELVHVLQQQGESPLSHVRERYLIQCQAALVEASNGSHWDALPPNARQVIDKALFNGLETEKQEAFRAVYSALQIVGLWNEVVHVLDAWTKNTRGIRAVVKSNLDSQLRRNQRFCLDTSYGKREHPGDNCWRQVVRAGTEGLHICIPMSNLLQMEAHIDTIAPVSGRKPDSEHGECRYSYIHVLPHILKDNLGVLDPNAVYPW